MGTVDGVQLTAHVDRDATRPGCFFSFGKRPLPVAFRETDTRIRHSVTTEVHTRPTEWWLDGLEWLKPVEFKTRDDGMVEATVEKTDWSGHVSFKESWTLLLPPARDIVLVEYTSKMDSSH